MSITAKRAAINTLLEGIDAGVPIGGDVLAEVIREPAESFKGPALPPWVDRAERKHDALAAYLTEQACLEREHYVLTHNELEDLHCEPCHDVLQRAGRDDPKYNWCWQCPRYDDPS